MQPAIRQYYHLEDLWGESPVRIKFGADKPVAKVVPKKAEQAKPTSLKRSSAAKKGSAEAFPSRAQQQKAAAKAAGSATRKSAAGNTTALKAAKPAPKVVRVNAPKPAAKKAAAKAPAKKAPAKKTAKRKG
jgi:ribosome-associated protein